MRETLSGLSHYLGTTRNATHRLPVWLDAAVPPDSQASAFARAEDWFFGVLHSRAHAVWLPRMGTWLGVGNAPRYTPTTCFETFPLPWPPGQEPAGDTQVVAVPAAEPLDDVHPAWLDPPRANPEQLRKRTLTNLYNERPTWLAHRHAALNRPVREAYGWEDDPAETADEQIFERLLALNLERTGR
jgi:hypothetical protein